MVGCNNVRAALPAGGILHLWRGAAVGADGGDRGIVDAHEHLDALLARLGLPPDAPICLVQDLGS